MTRIHASCVVLDGHGVLITGRSGAGKSDLALRLLDHPGYGIGNHLIQARLVGDDQIVLTQAAGKLLASPAPGLEGLLEVRGLGIVKMDHESQATVELVVTLAPAGKIERLPDCSTLQSKVAGILLPTVEIDPAQQSAPARVRSALTAILESRLLEA